MNKLTILTFTLFFSLTLSAQKVGNGWKKTPDDRKECRKIGNNLYLSAGFTPPFLSIYEYRYNYFYEDGTNLIETISIPQKSIATIELEFNLRYNLFNFRDFFSISATYSPAISFHEMGLGKVYMNNPISIDLNFFNHSTFNNIDNLGFSLSGGIQNHKINAKTDISTIANDLKWQDVFGRLTIKFRKYKSTESIRFNPKKYYYSYFALQYGMSSQTLSIATGESITDKFSHAKIVYGKIFRY